MFSVAIDGKGLQLARLRASVRYFSASHMLVASAGSGYSRWQRRLPAILDLGSAVSASKRRNIHECSVVGRLGANR